MKVKLDGADGKVRWVNVEIEYRGTMRRHSGQCLICTMRPVKVVLREILKPRKK